VKGGAPCSRQVDPDEVIVADIAVGAHREVRRDEVREFAKRPAPAVILHSTPPALNPGIGLAPTQPRPIVSNVTAPAVP
jgi:hypothetical protein